MDLLTIPQPKIAPGTWFDDLPESIERRCCPHKFCVTVLEKRIVPTLDCSSPTGASVFYSYYRGNGERHDDFGASTVDGLIEQLNNESFYPVDGDFYRNDPEYNSRA